jgi:hypothetical protein
VPSKGIDFLFQICYKVANASGRAPRGLFVVLSFFSFFKEGIMGDPQKFVPWIIILLALPIAVAVLAEIFLAACEWWQGKKGGEE